jgi:hypothetical protein
VSTLAQSQPKIPFGLRTLLDATRDLHAMSQGRLCRFSSTIVSGEGASEILESAEDSFAKRRPVVPPGAKESRRTDVKLCLDPTARISRFPRFRVPRIVLRIRSCFPGGQPRTANKSYARHSPAIAGDALHG